MGKLSTNNLALYYNEFDFSGHHNAVELPLEREDIQIPAFGDSSIARLAGFKSFEMSHEGYFEASSDGDKPDDEFWDRLSDKDNLLCIIPEGATAGNIAYFSKGVQTLYETGGEVGGVIPFTGLCKSQGNPIVRGTVLAAGTKTSTASGTAYNLGAVSSDQSIYCAVIVTSGTGDGDEMELKVQSDSAEGFGGPTNRITSGLASLTVATSVYTSPIPGAITDTWWRADWTIAGSSPSFTFVIVAGIL